MTEIKPYHEHKYTATREVATEKEAVDLLQELSGDLVREYRCLLMHGDIDDFLKYAFCSLIAMNDLFKHYKWEVPNEKKITSLGASFRNIMDREDQYVKIKDL